MVPGLFVYLHEFSDRVKNVSQNIHIPVLSREANQMDAHWGDCQILSFWVELLLLGSQVEPCREREVRSFLQDSVHVLLVEKYYGKKHLFP